MKFRSEELRKHFFGVYEVSLEIEIEIEIPQ